jgi:hypothetical protein
MTPEPHAPKAPPARDDPASKRATEQAQTALDNTRRHYDKSPAGDVGQGQSKDNPIMPGNGS